MRWSQNYVLPDGVVEEDGVLRDDADGLPQRGLGHLSDVLVVNQNRAFLKLKKAGPFQIITFSFLLIKNNQDFKCQLEILFWPLYRFVLLRII
jgi:hypothetical protein